MKRNSENRALKPSQRESITEYTSRFGTGISYEDKLRGKKIAGYIAVILCLLALVYIGFFLTELLIGITELPAFIHFFPEGAQEWILSLSIPV